MLIEFYCLPFLHTISIPAQPIIPINPDSNLSSVFAGQQVSRKQNDSILDCLLVLPPLLCWRFWQLGALSLLYIATQHVSSKGDGRVTLSWRHLRQGTEMLSWAHLRGNLFNALPESSTIWFTLFRGDIHSAVLPSYRCIAWIRPWTSHWRSSTGRTGSICLLLGRDLGKDLQQCKALRNCKQGAVWSSSFEQNWRQSYNCRNILIRVTFHTFHFIFSNMGRPTELAALLLWNYLDCESLPVGLRRALREST